MKNVRLLLSVCVVGLLSITTVFGQIDSLFLVGDATPSGWNISSPVPMIQSEADTNVFTWEGILTVGKLKLSTFTGDWCDSDWLNASAPDQPIDSAEYVIRHGCDGPDNQWVVDTDAVGKYLLTVNFTDESIVFNQVSETSIDSIFIVGDATPSGWDIASPVAMTKDESNPYIFKWQGVLKEGEMKFSTFTGNWCDGDWINPSDTNQSVSATDFIITHGCDGPDNKWLVTAADTGEYVITINLTDTLITMIPYVEPVFDSLFIVGDGTPTGWNIATPEPMIQDPNNSKIFTWEGALIAGEMKFSNFSGDWCDGEWINSAVPDQSIGAMEYIVTFGCDGPDNKWRITEEEVGDYKITINLENETVSIQLKTSVEYQGLENLNIYPNPASGRLTIDLGYQTNASVEIYNIVGQIMYQSTIDNQLLDIDLAALNLEGMILVKVSNQNHSTVSKIIIK